ncbi:MAG: hypothetical protein H7Y88_11790 [Phycisphaerales bacterium]|nr:hypothetical protein [Phycisphaerales bacterium]
MSKPVIWIALCATAATVLFVNGCGSAGHARVVSPATPAQQSVLLDRVKQLEGEWAMLDESGNRQPGVVYKVTSAGSSVREVMFPGSEHEMTNVYHMDGPTLVMTHYCAQGNQPRMRAEAGSPDRIDFEFDSVTNLRSADDEYMGEMSLIMKDHDHLRQEWRSLKKGKASSHAEFDLVRVK